MTTAQLTEVKTRRNEKAEELRQALPQFTGSTEFYRHWLGFIYTEGIKYLAEKAGAYWLIDAIGSHQIRRQVMDCRFQVWTLTVSKDRSAYLTMREDVGEPCKVSQEIPFTDFPQDSIKLLFIDGTLLLPSEY